MKTTGTERQMVRAGGVRRGSALIIVLGALALLSVFAAIYLSIGRSDRSTAAALERRVERTDIAEQVAAYVASVVAEDRLDVFAEQAAPGTRPQTTTFRRETWDYPWTDFTVRSQVRNSSTGTNLPDTFEPSASGRSVAPWTLSGPDLRVASDPWLASTEPEWLGDPRQRPGTNLGFSGGDAGRLYLDNRDWRQISNVAPDLRFVNLFNLRPESNRYGLGGFDSEAGIGTYADSQGSTRSRMTMGLTLLNLRADGRLQSYLPTSEAWFPGLNTPQSVGAAMFPAVSGYEDLLNVPAVWTMHQRYLFFPANQPFFVYDSNGQITDWSNPEYPPYQYADADGDGMYDSRWFELVDARIQDEIRRLVGSDDYRVFAAVRIEDLSARVNVNVATDQLSPPTAKHPWGLTPAEVDLRRLLTLTDVSGEFRSSPNAAAFAGLSYEFIDQPPEQARQRGQVDPSELYTRRGGLQAGNLTGYSAALPLSLADPRLAGEFAAETFGRAAYDAIRVAINSGTTLDDRYRLDASANLTGPLAVTDLVTDSWLVRPIDPLTGQRPARSGDAAEWAERRFDYFNEVGRIDLRLSLGRQVDSDVAENYGRGLFDFDDLAELLTYNGLNDPAVTSRLERVVMGRVENGAATTRENSRRLSPLLTNRTLDIDRFGHGDGRLAGRPDPYAGRPSFYPSVDGTIDEESMALFALSPRLRLTTWSGAVPLASDRVTVTSGVPAGIGTGEVAAGLPGSARALFQAFVGSMAADAGGVGAGNTTRDKGVWRDNLRNPGTNPIQQRATLFYGNDGPELAIRLAAHAALNASAMFTGRSTPGTLLLDNGVLEDVAGQEPTDPRNVTRAELERYLYPWWRFGEALDPGADRLPGTRGANAGTGQGNTGGPGRAFFTDESRAAANVFPVAPHPVITEAATIVVYTDRPRTAGGDSDGGLFEGPGPRPNIAGPPAPRPVTIDREPVLQVLAVQVHNPYDRAVSLSRPDDVSQQAQTATTNATLLRDRTGGSYQRELFNYYVEYGGRFYRLALYADSEIDSSFAGPGVQYLPVAPGERFREVVLGAGQTRTFYALLEDDIRAADSEWSAILSAYGQSPADVDQNPNTGPAREWLARQLRIATGGDAVLMREFDPRNGADIVDPARDFFAVRPGLPATGASAETPSVSAVGSLSLAQRAATDVVRLWKRQVVATEHADPNAGTTTAAAFNENLLANDQLVDRLWLGAGDALDERLTFATAGNDIEVEDSVGYEENRVPELDCSLPAGSEVARNDNTGLTLVRWASVRRPDPEGVVLAQAPEAGVLPAWLLSRRDATLNVRSSAERDANFPDFDGELNIADFVEVCPGSSDPIDGPLTQVRVKADYEIQPSLRALYNLASGRRVVRTLAEEPWRKLRGLGYDGGPVSLADEDNRTREKFPGNALGANAAGDTLSYSSTSTLKPEWSPTAYRNTTPRAADVLQALAVGPVQVPDPTRTTAGNSDAGLNFDVDGEWLTTAEMLAIGLGYDVPVYSSGASALARERIVDPYVGLVDAARTDEPKYALDGGRLRLGSYVPFVDASVGDVDDRVYDPSAGDLVRGDGLPMALSLLGRLNAVETVRRGSATSFGTANEAQELVTGKININTAPLVTLRMLPGLSPSFESFSLSGPTTAGTAEPEWWGRSQAVGLPDLSTPAQTPDAAAVVAAYRDRGLTIPRKLSDVDGDPIGTPSAIDYRPAVNTPADVVAAYVSNFQRGSGSPTWLATRGTISGITGLREQPGLASVGELMAMVADPANGAITPEAYLTLDVLGRDGEELGTVDTADRPITVESSLYNNGTEPDALTDEYEERLALTNALLGSVSVRSDTFAVWMVVQGFRQSDVESLRTGDPLVPSFAKRYLMVLDRSNVVDGGQAPRVLLFREVPL